MGSKSLKKILPIAAVVAAPMLGPALLGGSAAAGSAAAGGGLSSLLGSGMMKKFLINQAITAGLSKATTGKIDPKAQLMAGLMTGIGALGSGASAAEKAALAKSTSAMNPQALSKLQAGYAGMSRDAAAALAKGANPFASAASKGIGYGTGLVDPRLAQAAGMGTAASQTAGAMSALPGINAAKFAANNPSMFQNYLQSAPLTERIGQTAANFGRGLDKALFTKPETLGDFAKSAAAYSAPVALGAAMSSGKGTSNDPTAKENEQAQAFYDSALAMNEAMGGTDGAGYDTDTFNKLVGGYLSTMPGNYEKLSGDKATAADDGRVYAQLYPQLNYSGLNTFTSNPDRFKKLMGPYNPYVFADGGLANSGIMNSGSIPQTQNVPQGMQVDGRGGGFIPMGAQERKDDVPAMLAKNEFVMTADAVRAAGGGSINKGAQRMYDLMNSLEAKA